MNAKEKAKELVENFMQYQELPVTAKANAKQCAIISVGEILNTYPTVGGIPLYKDQIKHIDYWNKVKTEIQNL